MNTLLICLYIACLLPYLSKLPLAYAMSQLGGYDNTHPRAQQSALKGFGQRALAAHQNSFEALIIFGLAILVVICTGHVSIWAKYYAIGFIIFRIAYHTLYLANFSTTRSIVWFCGIYCSFALMGLPLFSH